MAIAHKRFTPQILGKSDQKTQSIFSQSTKITCMSTTDAITEAVSNIGKFLEKTSQTTPIGEIGDMKHSALQQLVNILAKKKEMKWYDTDPDRGVKNSGPEISPRRSPRFNPVFSTLPTPTNTPQSKPNGIRKSK